MARNWITRFGLGMTLVALCTTTVQAQASNEIAKLRKAALKFEARREWSKACSYYAFILSKDRDRHDIKHRFQLCLRQLHRTRRHEDQSYRYQVLRHDVRSAFKVYREIVNQIHKDYHEENRAGYQSLFQNGIDELLLSLEDKQFRQRYLPNASAEAVARFARQLRHDWRSRTIRDLIDAEQESLKLTLAAKQSLGLRPTVCVLELACGACNALDEHTCYLTPSDYREDLGALRGETAGVGIELAQAGEDYIITRVIINSPAARAGMVVGERLISIERQSIQALGLEQIKASLLGRAGSTIHLEVSADMSAPRTFTLVRMPIQVSVTDYRIVDMDAGVGYIQLSSFHENTLSELDDAISQLEMQGMKVLMLDLRGNSGGLFDSAVDVAERFLWEGASIVGTKGRDTSTKKTSRNLNPSTVPLVVLVDGSTASAAEIVAGALKENNRATLVGQNTFGKGTIQHMIELKTVQSGGLRITWAKFYSPLNNPYSNVGVAPHIFVEQNSLMDEQRGEARELARQIAGMAR